jgi:KipI family sensor histidine kinase inhibitor
LRVVPAGDLALSVEFTEEISVETNTRVRALEYLIEQKGVPGVVETVPGYRALLVYYDPSAVGYDALVTVLQGLAEQTDATVLPPPRQVEIPCCYEDPELGFDLVGAAERLGLSPAEVIRLHTSFEHLVYFIGFVPGLPYMDSPKPLTIKRLDTPRTKTPPGSVSIGGAQCCIYPVDSPGGFWVLGRTPLRLYDPAAAEPVLLRAGDRVRFRAISRAEFDHVNSRAPGLRPPARVE